MSDVLNVAALIGVLFAAIPLRAAQRARFRSFEELYVVRYWSLLDQMPPPPVAEPVEGSDEAHALERKVAWAYLRLTEDQFDMRRVGWVTDETWKLWVNGMSLSLQSAPASLAWQEARESQEGFAEIRKFADAGFSDGYDPNTMSASRRWLRGLAGISW